MPKVISSKYDSETSYVVEYLVENDTYKPWRARLFSQILQNVEVPGFRKGKAPENLALQQINQAAVEDTILRETVSKFADEALAEARKVVQSENRVIRDQSIDLDSEAGPETSEGFKFKVVLSLLPKIDLDPLEKLTLPKIDPKDLPDRLSIEDFISQEKSKFLASFNEYEETGEIVTAKSRVTLNLTETVEKETKDIKDRSYTLGVKELPVEFENNLIGLKTNEQKDFNVDLPITSGSKKTQLIKYSVTVKKILEPKFNNLEDIFSNSVEAKKQFPSPEKFVDFLKDFYEKETENINNEAKQRKIIQEVLKLIPDFNLANDQVEAEETRILGALERQAIETGVSLGQALINSGITDITNKVLDDKIDIKKQVNQYLVKEFKWIYILRTVYEIKVDKKIEPSELDTIVQEMSKKPQEYGIDSNLETDRIRDVAFDRLMRNRAASWIFNFVEEK